ncbi:ammonium transporter 1 member 3-like, partial [Stylophora pistillata]
MQTGFAFLEAGSVRSKNTTNILIKNFLDVFIGAVAYWLFGYAFAFGAESNAFIGHKYFALADLPADKYSHWFFHFVFAATAATIVSGAMAERTEFKAYLVYSVFLTGFVYPVVTHWAWDGNGWLATGLKYTKDNVTMSVTYQSQHDATLNKVLQRLSAAGVTLNAAKCEFNTTTIEVLGHIISLQGKRPHPDKVFAVVDMPPPKNVDEVRTFLGMVNHLGKFAEHLANKTKPIRDLAKTGTEWYWGPAQQRAFEE